MKGGDKPNESKKVIAMQMADKNMPDTLHFNMELPELHLGTLTAIHQKIGVIHVDEN
jgi:hypothetical protein